MNRVLRRFHKFHYLFFVLFQFTLWISTSNADCLTSLAPLFSDPPQKLSQTGVFENLTDLKACPYVIEYRVNVPLWSDGAEKRRWMVLPKNGKIEFSENQPWKFPVGTLFIKHFELRNSPNETTRVETRFLVSKSDGSWSGYTYQWDDQQTDATLLNSGAEKSYLVFQPNSPQEPKKQLWSFPNRAMCLQCHNTVAGSILGPRTEQMTQNQLETWNNLELFSTHLDKFKITEPYVSFKQSTEPLEKRVRSYLAANCAHCHQPNAPVRSNIDLRFQTPLPLTNMLNAYPNLGDMDLDDPSIIKPGDRKSSVLWLRLQTKTTRHMPPIGNNEQDHEAVEAIGAWIDQLPHS